MSTCAPPSSEARPDGGGEGRPGLRLPPAWRSRALLADAAVVATLTWWAVFLARGTGGREPHLLSIGCLLLAMAVVVVRPWRRVPAWALVLGHAVGGAAYGVVVLAPTGSAGADEAAALVFTAELLLVLLAWAATRTRRTLLLVAVLGSGVYQFSGGWLAWWGHQDPSTLFVGTIHWHNQAGIVLTAGAIAGAVLVARGGGDPLRLLGWFLTPLCVAGTVFTTSRGSMLGLVLGLALVAALGFARRGDRLAGVRVLLLTGLSWATTVAMAGPPVFSERTAALAGTTARSGSFVSNGTQRFEDWRRAWDIFLHWPVSGAGFNSYDAATDVASERRDGVTTAFAHNGFLQVMADGGLLLSVPVFTALTVIMIAALRRLPTSLRAGEWTQPGALVVLVVLLLHSGMDFDWAYPSILALTAVAGAAALPPSRPEAAVSRRRAVALGGAAVALLVLAAVAGWDGGLRINAELGG